MSSAAEKLAEFDDRLPLYSNQSQPLVWRLRHALPQIVAVVEAAEFFSESNGAAWPEVPAALAALDEQLQDLSSATEPEAPTPQ